MPESTNDTDMKSKHLRREEPDSEAASVTRRGKVPKPATVAAIGELMDHSRPVLTLRQEGTTPAIQASLAVSDPADRCEREADEVARRVLDGQSAEVHETGAIDREREGSVETTPEFQAKLQSSKGSGQSLDKLTRKEMESSMGANFSGVKFHTGSTAVELNTEVGARAFTHGRDIYFNAGKYDPSSAEGRKLLAHELAHTLQQSQKSFARHGLPATVSPQRIMRSPDAFAEATKSNDARTFYIRGESRVNKIKQTLTSADILFEGSPTKAYIVKKKPKGGALMEFYACTASTTSATSAAVRKVFNGIVPAGSEVFVTTDDFVNKLRTVVDTFRKSHPHSFSTLQVLGILNQPAVWVNVKKDGKVIREASCIETMNQCIQNVYGSGTVKKEKLSDTALGTIKKLEQQKLASEAGKQKVSLVYLGKGRFQIRKANIETVTKFDPKSLVQTLTDMTKNKEDGFHVYACSLLNGYHSILLIVKKLKGKYRFEWKDQDKAAGQEFDATQLHDEFYGYAAGRYSWRIRDRYQKEYGGALPDKYENIKDDQKLIKIEELEKASIIDDLKNTIIAPLTP